MIPMNKHIIAAACCLLATSLPPALAGAAPELVTNGDFSSGAQAWGVSPEGWNATLRPDQVGQITPDPPAQPSLAQAVGALGAGSQIMQTLDVTLAPNTTYTMKVDLQGAPGWSRFMTPSRNPLSTMGRRPNGRCGWTRTRSPCR
jgi:hypothetical protein